MFLGRGDCRAVSDKERWGIRTLGGLSSQEKLRQGKEFFQGVFGS